MVSSFILFAKRYPHKGLKYIQNIQNRSSVKSNVATLEKLTIHTNMKKACQSLFIISLWFDFFLFTMYHFFLPSASLGRFVYKQCTRKEMTDIYGAILSQFLLSGKFLSVDIFLSKFQPEDSTHRLRVRLPTVKKLVLSK